MVMVHVRMWMEVDEDTWKRRYGCESTEEVRAQAKTFAVTQVKLADEPAIEFVGLERQPAEVRR